MDILICVGASDYGLDRLLKIIDELCDEKILDGNHIIAQKGCAKYEPHNYQVFSLISREDFEIYMQKADVIISHAGTGSVISALKMNKKVIVFPRLLKYKEHLDDHQLELATVFTETGYTLCATNKDEMIYCLKQIQTFTPNPFQSNSENINKLIINFIENI